MVGLVCPAHHGVVPRGLSAARPCAGLRPCAFRPAGRGTVAVPGPAARHGLRPRTVRGLRPVGPCRHHGGGGARPCGGVVSVYAAGPHGRLADRGAGLRPLRRQSGGGAVAHPAGRGTATPAARCGGGRVGGLSRGLLRLFSRLPRGGRGWCPRSPVSSFRCCSRETVHWPRF